MTDDLAGFRQVLHEWARRYLEKYGHLGPFEIIGVDVAHEHGYGSPDTPADDDVVVSIRFRHPGGCPDWSCRPVSVWSMPDTTSTVAMLNELLVIGD